MVGYFGYVGVYPSKYNLAIVVATILALYVRAVREERFLDGDPAYREYRHRVRWRFVPYVY